MKAVALEGVTAVLDSIKEAVVKDAVFHKRRRLEVEEMAKSTWVYKRLRDLLSS